MNVTVINSSPHRRSGNTSLILLPFIKKLKEEGADVSLFYTRTEEIHPCVGDYACWYKTPGACSIHDSMTKILQAIRRSEILVLASPIYAVGMTGDLKLVLDRIMPLSKPHVAIHEEQCRLDLYDDVAVQKIVMVASCGFHSLKNFNAFTVEVADFSAKIRAEFAGKLLRPSADFFRIGVKNGEYRDIIDAAGKAAEELLWNGAVAERTEKIISREIITLEESAVQFNEFAQNRLNSRQE